MNESLDDTIIAVSTPPGQGGLGLIRISGHEALAIARGIFQPKKLSPAEHPGQMCFGYLVDREKGERLDCGYACYFRPEVSYTREEVVEISLHGSPVILNEAIRLGIKEGARLARPGEFTLRAYLRGRLDIVQAEAINDLIRAVSLQQAKVSFRQAEGSLSRKIQAVREQIVGLLVNIEASLEFPEDELGLTQKEIESYLEHLISNLKNIIWSYEQNRARLEGLTIALVGRTNAGKSTLFNALLEEERAIVTPYPGTTRDYIRENLLLDGILLKLVDTAGFGQADNAAEEAGISRSEDIATRADGLLIILDSSRSESEEDFYLLQGFQGKKRIIVFNKSDLDKVINRQLIIEKNKEIPWIEVSALTGENIEQLKRLMLTTFSPAESGQEEIILHERQKILIEQMAGQLEEARNRLEAGYGLEIIAEEIKAVLPAIGEFTGEIKSSEVINEIFGRFCLGK
ncbi:MAG TPA: tRNA uridine-5-carboxymethylaminomethyl(34) synthesis GTPase MnmE [Candidatus Saccharicenans sp.]|nr:tRNA uridine-5-carboxymethylaminomethyl(34) synthesis GTPase MnmE [Candidatus Saccharicenans sp.]HOJ25862.1 tRNA uridine-5-carboxymethylaminomethyl(34) synthesis GTPase MnmE [Candidatus Saccharicenans sp.]HOL45030.1 tRNA uridine-5-carboxymethylaminomethyl(34) synthesis GTPase MnmE [Candidatus Saccharicenans sp.]HOM93449.1 tRNA uridine-5-carboxymethylaminomethyl(34) synthesis GTPase MnmE [Candidatus Saccharicenans sp.]HOP60392.1 tRNA uridine-5-carboxymethylaminomethyl(34) synthesis GTPase Mnm